MQNHLHHFMTSLHAYAKGHGMIAQVHIVKGESELDTMVFDEKTLVLVIDSANISNEDGNPIYTIRFIAAVVGRGKYGQLGPTVEVEESLFIMSQIQDWVDDYTNGVGEFGEIDIQTDFDDSGDLVALSTIFEVKFGRGYCDAQAY